MYLSRHFYYISNCASTMHPFAEKALLRLTHLFIYLMALPECKYW
ncbi:hypothetical protein PROVALCAL_01487 [Providencia alcalifaciens DSM 30120]|uniref:Uncharacterized protein n=1 Tax=Providencia alcalifaciens DSM 30120 TaxID=520999 RepID=B6XDR2_9GAMM|nr:hypothetical protein PROVALCAL_01487 [Providencia alcalifaciens DSM 30120]